MCRCNQRLACIKYNQLTQRFTELFHPVPQSGNKNRAGHIERIHSRRLKPVCRTKAKTKRKGGRMKTKITELLGIQHPIVLAPMAWITDAVLAAAVSEAGGLGTIGPNSGSETVTRDVKETGERLRREIRKCRSLTRRPFAVNIVVGVGGLDRAYSDCCVEVGIEEKIPVAVVSQGNPRVYTRRLKEAGMKVIHVCSTVRHVFNAEASGADAVVVSGTEGGGHSGFDQITTLCLVPQAVAAVDIPVISGGGIVNARGLMGALALGAEGVYMGTRFMATQECPAHPNVKAVLLKATDTSTIAVPHGNPVLEKGAGIGDRGFVEERRGSVRMLILDSSDPLFAQKDGRLSYDQAFSQQESPDPNVQSDRTMDTFIRGNLTNALTAGQGVGMIDDIPTCRDLIARIMGETEPIFRRLSQIVKESSSKAFDSGKT